MTPNKILFCYILSCVSFGLLSAAPSDTNHNGKEMEVTDLAMNLENWMGDLPQNLKAVPIKNLAIPGSHDSFTSDITSKSEVSPDGQEILKALEKLAIAKLVISNWAKTQAFDVVGQLKAGIRFFDLRICKDRNDKDLYFCHSMYSTEVQSVLSDMNSYLDAHPQEVVILDCQHFYNCTVETHNTVIQILKDTFGTKLIPYQSNMETLTLEYLGSQKKQVIVVYRHSTQSGQNLLWPTQSFPTPWYDTMDTTKLISDLNTGLSIRSPNVGHISQLILTPKVEDILLNVLSSLKQKCAEDFENLRTQWIENQTPGKKGVNIIIVDFIDLSDNLYPRTVINLNLKLSKELEFQKTILGKIQSFIQTIKEYVL